MSDEDKKEPADPTSDDASEDGEDEAPAEAAPKRVARSTSRKRRETAVLVDEDGEDAPADVKGAATDKPTHKPNFAFFGVVTAVAAALDLGTKEWAAERLKEPGSKIVVIENYVHFDLATNKGGAWGFLGDQPDSVRLPFFFAISAFAVWFIVRMFRQLEPRQRALKWALPLVLGGAIGNLVDRIRHQHVIDFIDCFAVIEGAEKHWPTYNIADVWIVAGVILMLIDGLMPKPRKVLRRVPVKKAADVEADAAKSTTDDDEGPASKGAARKVEDDAEKASA